MTKADLEGVLTAITDKAKGLRDAGVTSLSIDGIRIELAPSDPPPMPKSDGAPDEFPSSLDDPMTYGRSRGVPGRSRREESK